MSGFTAKDVPSQRGKCVVVTGANTGIGFAAAHVLAERGARVLLACRDRDKAQNAMARIRNAVPSADLAFVPLDQADLGSVRDAAEIIGWEPRVDVLLNNAGVMFPPLQRTVQGHELQFGVNHLGTFALTGLLLGKLAQTPGSRVVVTSSLAHGGGKIDWDDIDAYRSYSRTQRYSDSKLMNLLFAFELDRRLRAAGSPLKAIACHPGIAATELVRHLPAIARLSWPVMTMVLNSAEQGAWPALQAATASGVQGGEYYGPQRLRGAAGPSGLARCKDKARDTIAAERLWNLSVELTGVDPLSGK
ncbi:oxidoreductase [Novosphingobium sp. 9U]|uniref:oxidoreductase n=1 Tax=Novosphingobium sp. 9U TaxID=2653158 RepID=UPI0012F2B007|nr:oxidoreductase [Novosphingobium sp. 9U]VWX51308.1 Oxidoreductase [Novosphingobium sp. 9U]